MKIWAVFIHCTAAGYQSRWIDSEWAVYAKARERELEVDRIMNAFGVSAHKTTTVEMSVTDVAIVGEHAAPMPNPEGPGDDTQATNGLSEKLP